MEITISSSTLFDLFACTLKLCYDQIGSVSNVLFQQTKLQLGVVAVAHKKKTEIYMQALNRWIRMCFFFHLKCASMFRLFVDTINVILIEANAMNE